ncbi:MAG: hypothetical protein WBC85_00560, partial [Planktotalea sp.]|uniref:hypothetical protein n=1 Tax=Planktotalea sp. TaxID=2029877 RepID=UPI003C73A690
MSAILLVLLSGLTMFGVSLMEPAEVSTDESETDADTAQDPVEGGSNPLDEALEPKTTEAEDEETVDPDLPVTPVDPDADTITG